jgi:hypothetical protein
MSSLAR